ncbi:Protein kinase superfamily protein [Zostera marina]|uniref:non-specific serine/threonine protein kinase n=1 Tax=Zostera marina TaxID=29655 RepID=A0A0K9PRT3_ZOSMR|nr:Protein kinase superfamily protein [Zostera marina]
MAAISPASAPPPASTPPITIPSVSSPSNSTAIPPATPSAPPPATPSAPPPATLSAPPPAILSAPPPATPSIPSPPVTSSPSPPATVLTPPPAIPSSPPPPAEILTPPPATPSSPPPPVDVLTPPPATPSTPSPPAEVLTPPAISSPPTSTAPPSTESPPIPASPTPSVAASPTPSVAASPPSQSPNASVPSTPSLPVPVTPSPPDSTTSPPPPSLNTNSKSSGSGISTGSVAGIVVGGGLFLLLLLALFFILRKRNSRKNETQTPTNDGDQYPASGQIANKWKEQDFPPPANHVVNVVGVNSNSSGASGSTYSIPATPSTGLGFSQSLFTYEEIVKATDGFSDANLLGQGGFGYVHRGVLSDGKQVAVKQLKAGSGQGEREFQAEVEIISRVHHRHLVSLVGYCTTGDKRILIYEFVPNYTLEFHLHAQGRPTMEWSTRIKIALGSAKGLAYLHEDCHPKIIHRDIKAANILIDFQFEAMVADFGLAKFTADNNTHISTRVMGTFGYLAPEYASSGKLSEKSDVFSFGVMLLELITGRRPIDTTNTFNDDDSLVDWARPLLTRAIEENKYDGLIDPRLQNNYDINEMARIVASAAACIRHSARRRPRMSKIVRTLEGGVNLEDVYQGIKPGHSTMYNSSVESSDYDSAMYREDMNKFRKLALASQEYGSSEYSHGTTSEYGLNPSGSSSEVQPQRMENKSRMKNDI